MATARIINDAVSAAFLTKKPKDLVWYEISSVLTKGDLVPANVDSGIMLKDSTVYILNSDKDKGWGKQFTSASINKDGKEIGTKILSTNETNELPRVTNVLYPKALDAYR